MPATQQAMIRAPHRRNRTETAVALTMETQIQIAQPETVQMPATQQATIRVPHRRNRTEITVARTAEAQPETVQTPTTRTAAVQITTAHNLQTAANPTPQTPTTLSQSPSL